MTCSAISTLTEVAMEQGSYIVTLTFVDEENAAAIPNTLKWSWFDLEGNVINERQDVSAAPAAEVNIVLSGDDLAISGDGDCEMRRLVIEGTYESEAFGELNLNGSVLIEVANLKGI